MKQRLLGTLVVSALLLTSASAWAADAAAEIYKAKCANCHGADGAANNPMGKKLAIKPVKDPSVAKLTEKEFIDITTNGKAKMPAYKGTLTASQIKAVSAYMKGLK